MAALAAYVSEPRSRAAVVEERHVTLNTKTLVYHCPVCELVRRCGADCETVDLTEALRRRARPCATCSGICAER